MSLFNRLLQSVTILILLFATIAKAEITTTSRAAILMEAQTGRILFEKNADLSIPPASMSKMMTIYIIFDALKKGEIKLTDTFHISKNARAQIGSRMFINVNEDITVENLLKGAIIQSGNDACVALAEGLSGSVDVFVMRMNDMAEKLGMTASTFANPTGLPDDNHRMSVKDLALLGRALVYDFPEYYKLYSETEFTWNKIRQPNRNPLLGYFNGADGIKTGHTEEAGYCLVGSAKRGKMRLISVVSGLNSNGQRKDESAKLLGYGFSAFDTKTLSKDIIVSQLPVYLGATKKLDVTLEKDVDLLVKKTDLDKVSLELNAKLPIVAPISKGDVVGEILVKVPDQKESYVYNVVAKQDILKAGLWDRFITSANYFLFGPSEYTIDIAP